MQKRGSYKVGIQRREQILNVARNLFLEEGYHNFSLRKVAKLVGISPGNLQHHFASHDDLISNMLDAEIGFHLQRLKSEQCTSSSPREYLFNVIKYVVFDLSRRETTLFFPEVWSLANHDSNVDKMMQRMYAVVCEIYEEIATAINPALSDEQAARIGLFITASIEGHTMFLGNKKPFVSLAEATSKMIYDASLQLIESGNIPESG